jgi:hypothetical protein
MNRSVSSTVARVALALFVGGVMARLTAGMMLDSTTQDIPPSQFQLLDCCVREDQIDPDMASAQLQQAIATAVTRNGGQFTALTAQRPAPDAGIAQIALTMEFTAPSAQIVKILEALEAMKPSIAVLSLEVSESADGAKIRVTALQWLKVEQ